MFIGGTIPFLIASITMTAVGDAAFDMINEIRRQFEKSGLLEGNAEPDTERCVDIATTALKRMVVLVRSPYWHRLWLDLAWDDRWAACWPVACSAAF